MALQEHKLAVTDVASEVLYGKEISLHQCQP